MPLQHAGSAADGLAVVVDLCRQRFDAIICGADLRQNLDPAPVDDVIFAIDRVPQRQPMLTEFARWCIAGRARFDQG